MPSLADYDYTLPPELIAERPLPERSSSRMMVVHRATGVIEHRHFANFPGFIRAGDLVVLNNTKVMPARVFSDDGRIEMLFLEALREATWKCMVRPGRKMRVGAEVSAGGVRGRVLEILPEGERIIAFDAPIDLEACGRLPLPPYIERDLEPEDAERYQTVFARESGAVAAPTAGLHFTPGILAQVPHTFITLHVGAGTFRPVQVEDITEHRMHAERFRIEAPAAAAIREAQRVIACGTTTTRVLESAARAAHGIAAVESATDIFIYPPFEFQVVDTLLTNFHLPRSTLLMLVSAFAGRDLILHAYAEAIRERYRFFSYGDCMLLL